MKVYLIKACDGTHTDRVFLRPPTEAELREVLERTLVEHGHKNGKPVQRDVSYITIETTGEPEDAPEKPLKLSDKLTEEESEAVLDSKKADQASGQVVSGADGIKFEGVGEVILIDDPRHPRYDAVR